MLQCTFIKVSHRPPLQVTGWVLLPELVPVSLSGARISCGLQLAWRHDEMTLLAGGDTRVTLATTEYNMYWSYRQKIAKLTTYFLYLHSHSSQRFEL